MDDCSWSWFTESLVPPEGLSDVVTFKGPTTFTDLSSTVSRLIGAFIELQDLD